MQRPSFEFAAFFNSLGYGAVMLGVGITLELISYKILENFVRKISYFAKLAFVMRTKQNFAKLAY